VRENRTQGSARGLPGNGQFYLNDNHPLLPDYTLESFPYPLFPSHTSGTWLRVALPPQTHRTFG